MLEYILLYYLLDRTIYNKYYKYTNITNKELLKLYYIVKALHESNDKDKQTVQDLEVKFFTEYPFLKDVEKEQYASIFARFNDVTVDGTDVESLLKKQREMSHARQLAEIAIKVSDGNGDFTEITELLITK